MKNHGFTLLEILVVLALLLVGLGVLSDLLSSSLRQSVEAEEKTSIQVACQNRLNGFVSGEESISDGLSQPIEGFGGWFMTVHLESAPLPTLARIRIVAQKFETVEGDSGRAGTIGISQIPIAGQQIVLSQWVRRSDLSLQSTVNPVIGSLGSGGTPAATAFQPGGMIGNLQTPGSVGDSSSFPAPDGGESGTIGGLGLPPAESLDPFSASGFTPSGETP